MSETAILSNKHALLSALGTKYNDLYYSAANSSVSLVETTFQWQNIISLSSKDFGSSSQVNIPIDQFIQEVILHLRVRTPIANETLCRGWGYAILQSVSYVLGASNSTQVVLQEDAILLTLFAQCISEVKRSELLRLGGEEQLNPPVTPSGEADPLMDAYIAIPLPFSTACDKLPMDSTLLSNNISVTFNFKQANSIFGGSATHPTAFTVAEVMLRQGKLSNQAASLRQEMIAHPDLIYSYPFIHAQRFVSGPFTGSRTSDTLRGCSVTLNSFANADLVGIVLWVVKDTDKNPVSNNSPNPYNTDELSDVLVSFNGSTLFNFPARSYKLTNALIGEQQASYFHNSVIAPGATAPFSSIPKDCYPVFLDFARLRSACMQEHLFNTWRIPNQNMLIEFSTQFGSSVSYRLHATYFYNGIAEFQSGTSAIYIG
jgi:hypothetical protein